MGSSFESTAFLTLTTLPPPSSRGTVLPDVQQQLPSNALAATVALRQRLLPSVCPAAHIRQRRQVDLAVVKREADLAVDARRQLQRAALQPSSAGSDSGSRDINNIDGRGKGKK